MIKKNYKSKQEIRIDNYLKKKKYKHGIWKKKI